MSRKALGRLMTGAGLVAGAALWEFAGRSVGAAFVAPLSDTIEALTPAVWRALASSLALFATGFTLSVAIGVPLGLLLARVRLMRVALESYISMLNATPMAALIPFILSMMGFDFAPKVLVVFLFAVFPILYNTVEGARSIRPELIEVARSFRSSERALWRDVLLPFVLPFALTGIRQAIGRALVGMVASEFFLSASGIGMVLQSASQSIDTATVFAAILLVTLLGVLLMELGLWVERRYAAWRNIE
jgi:ABC-type nitrate/sulfonate/bicarbonate transport system permease component